MNRIKSFFNQASNATKMMCVSTAAMAGAAAIQIATGLYIPAATMLLATALTGTAAYMLWQKDKRAAAKDNMLNAPAPITPK
jgi:hypothetical protein